MLVGMGPQVMPLLHDALNQRREAGIAQEVAGKKETALGLMPRQLLENRIAALGKLMPRKDQGQAFGMRWAANDALVPILQLEPRHRRTCARGFSGKCSPQTSCRNDPCHEQSAELCDAHRERNCRRSSRECEEKLAAQRRRL